MILSLKAVQSSPVPAPVEYKKERFYATTLIEIATKTGEATLDIFTLGNLFLIAIDNNPHTAHQPSTMSGDSVHPANDMWCTAVQAVPPPPWSLQNILGSGFWSSSWYMQKSSSREYFANMGGAPQSAAVKSAQISEVGLLIIVFLSRLMLKTPLCTVQCRCATLYNIEEYFPMLNNIVQQWCKTLYIALHYIVCDALYCNAWQYNPKYCKFCKKLLWIPPPINSVLLRPQSWNWHLTKKQSHKPLIFNYFAFQQKKNEINRYLLIFQSSKMEAANSAIPAYRLRF